MKRLTPWLDKHTTPELETARIIITQAAEPLVILHGLCISSRETQRLIREAVAECREQGRSWAEIAKAMGITRQAARRRFMHLDGGTNPGD